MLMTMRSLTEGCRAMAMVAAAAYDAAHHHPDPEVRKQNQAFYEFMVPLVKGYSTEMSLEVTSLGVQVHGGMGFIEETGAAQYYRDARILPIYEGTTAIQANDLVGRKTARDGGQTAKASRSRSRRPSRTWASGSSVAARAVLKRLTAARQAFVDVVEFIASNSRSAPNAAFAGSVPYLMLAGNLVAGWQLARSLAVAEDLAAKGEDQPFMHAKVATRAVLRRAHPGPRARPARQHRRRRGQRPPRWQSTLSDSLERSHVQAAQGLCRTCRFRDRCAAVHRQQPQARDRAVQGGIVGSMPSLNARPASQLDEWLQEITETLAAWNRDHPEQPAAPFAINQIVHKSNDRLEHDMEAVVKYKVPVIITSLGARTDVNDAIHSYGGVVMHDIINNMFARKAIEKGADGLIAGRRGRGRPCRREEPVRADPGDPPVVRRPAGAVRRDRHRRRRAVGAGHGRGLRVHRLGLHRHARGARQRCLQAGHRRRHSDEIVYSNLFTGVHGNYLKASIAPPAWTRTTCPRATPAR
jgi:hypothetical protein